MSIYFCLLYIKNKGLQRTFVALKIRTRRKKNMFYFIFNSNLIFKNCKTIFPDLINDRNVLSINEVYCVSIVNDFFKIIHINVN